MKKKKVNDFTTEICFLFVWLGFFSNALFIQLVFSCLCYFGGGFFVVLIFWFGFVLFCCCCLFGFGFVLFFQISPGVAELYTKECWPCLH